MNDYFRWGLTRIIMRFVAYFILVPIMVVLFPIVTLGDLIGKAYYHFTGW